MLINKIVAKEKLNEKKEILTVYLSLYLNFSQGGMLANLSLPT